MALKRFVNLATLPYYRMFQFYTYQPIILIAAYTSSPEKSYKVLYHLDRWRTRKLSELQFVSIAVSYLKSLYISPYLAPPTLISFQIDRSCHPPVRHPRRRHHWLLLLERHRRRLLARLRVLVFQPNPLHPRHPARRPTDRRAPAPRQAIAHTANNQQRLCSRESGRASLPTPNTQGGGPACRVIVIAAR